MKLSFSGRNCANKTCISFKFMRIVVVAMDSVARDITATIGNTFSCISVPRKAHTPLNIDSHDKAFALYDIVHVQFIFLLTVELNCDCYNL